MINTYTESPPVKVATLPWGFGLGDQANPFQACPLDWAWCPRVRDRRTHPLRGPGRALQWKSQGKSGRLSQGGCRSSRDSQACPSTPGPSPSARGQVREAVFGSHPAGSHGPPPFSLLRRACVPAGGPPERARSPRPRRRTPSRGSCTSPERGGLTGHAPELGPVPWEPSACTRRARGSPSRGAALRRPLSPMRWPACAGREPGWLPSPPTVRLAGGRARQGGRAGTGTLENFGVRLCLQGCQGGNRTLGLRDAHPLHREDAWELGKGSLPIGFRGPQKAHTGELQDSRKIPHPLEFSQGTQGVRSCLEY